MPDVDIAAAKDRMKAVWALGDYTAVEPLTGQAARPLVDACAVSAGQEVLDVAAGSGNVALAAATEGARVVASDITPAMIELGRRRSEAAGVDIEWVEADAEELPFGDASFDCVLSAFGVMLAPRPEVAVREVFRVLRPGGAFGMTAWTPDSMIPAQGALASRYLPLPAELSNPSEWGAPEVAQARLGEVSSRVETEIREAEWTGASPDEYASLVEQHVGPNVAARRALPPDKYERLSHDLLDLARERAEGDGPVTIRFEYLLIVARKPG
jgi:ubiquinone/menaquinone biosynthesis C-methylase UbiE